MRRWWLLALAVTAACYQPTISAGAPCGPGDSCPSGQECRSGYCFLEGAPIDAEQVIDDGGAQIDAAAVAIDAAVDAMPLGPWSMPTGIPSLETPDDGEGDPSISSDRLTAVINATTASGDTDIYVGTRTATTMAFTTTRINALNSDDDDDSPEISADGRTIYFSSDRATTGSADIYMSTFTTSWSMPTVVAALSTTNDDSDVAISPDGLTAVVVDSSGSNKLRFHTRASTAVPFSATATMHAELHIDVDVGAPTIMNGAQTIYVHAGGTRDLYVAQKQGNGTYTTPAPVTELNTMGRDASPFVLQSDRYMIFEREGDIFETTR